MNIYETCVQKFRTKSQQKRHIGIEAEIPVVQRTGEPVPYSLIHQMYLYLQNKGFELIKEEAIIVEACIQQDEPPLPTIVTTDLGYSTLEIILPPVANLHKANSKFYGIIKILSTFFDRHNCLLLGYGIHPLALPSKGLVTPRKRYQNLEKLWNTHYFVPSSLGNDTHLLTLSAGNQCHIDLTETEAVQAANILNASSGLQIALQANAPIWKGKIDNNYKAVREVFYDVLGASSGDRFGISPRFDTLEEYFQYIAKQSLNLVVRNDEVLKIKDLTFEEYLTKDIVEAVKTNGEKVWIKPKVEDIHYHNSITYFNARLVPKYGTIEVRMPCQQPPNETMVTAALNLGLVENLDEAIPFFNQFDRNIWAHLRTAAIKNTFYAKLPDGNNILLLIWQMLHVAQRGLEQRGLGEDIFLQPLFERLKKRESPADKAVKIFKNHGMRGLLNEYAFNEKGIELTTRQAIFHKAY